MCPCWQGGSWRGWKLHLNSLSSSAVCALAEESNSRRWSHVVVSQRTLTKDPVEAVKIV